MRYFFQASYHGRNYHGWQIQKNAITVQQVINEALSTVIGMPVTTLGSGRTDTGVHASGQVFQADFEGPVNAEDLRFKLNSLLPADISINSIRAVKNDASARFDALARTYMYNLHLQKNPFLQHTSYYFRQHPDLLAMNNAAGLLPRYDDFESFSRVKTEVNHFQCQVQKAEWVQQGDLLTFHITANRFLRGMVRAVVGTLLDVGTGRTGQEEFVRIIEGKDRKKAGRSVPAQGLFLTVVRYPEDIYLAGNSGAQ